MRRGSTMVLRVAIFVMGLAVVALCACLPWVLNIGKQTTGPFAHLKYPALIGAYATAILFFTALWQALKLLRYIDENTAFSEGSVKALTVIRWCAVGISAVYILGGLPIFYYIADVGDAPGVMLIGMSLAGAAVVVAVFASILRRLLGDAIAAKTENDLTV